jgi:CubicO group peptidase (beta-lactamase class C family)
MTLDSVFWIASCTKMVAGIACMQLVEQGKLSLDDAASVEEIAPELKRAKVLKGFDENNKPILEDKKTGITLRMLLTHTG